MENKPIPAGHAKTGTYVGEGRKLDAIFCVSGFQEFVETNASAPTVKLQIIRAVAAVIAYRKLNFRAMDAPCAFLMDGHLKREEYAKLPDGVEKENIAPDQLKPLYGTGTARKDWCETARDFPAEECGRKRNIDG